MTSPSGSAGARIAVVIGTRAQLIKMAPVMRLLQDRQIPYRFIQTSQHRGTFDEIRDDFGIKPPDYVLFDWTDEARTLGRIGGWFAIGLVKLLLQRRTILPLSGGIVLTHGDTASTVWGALLGRLTSNQVMHVESGLRSFSLLQPFPEEINRLLTFRLSHVFACPDQRAVKNLRKYRGEKIDTRGNTLYDAVMAAASESRGADVELPDGPYALASIHRFENLFRTRRLQSVVEILEEVSETVPLVIIQHPVTARRLERTGMLQRLQEKSSVQLVPRTGFFTFQRLLAGAQFVITDGGSNQEELFYLGIPTLILRKVSERTEGLRTTAVLADLDREKVRSFVADHSRYTRKSFRAEVSPSGIIVDWLLEKGYGGVHRGT